MRLRFAAVAVVLGALIVALVVIIRAAGTEGSASTIPRTQDDKPDLNGIWQAINTANWNLQDHAASQGPVIALGAAFSVPAGYGVVEGNDIPYKPEALAQKKQNAEKWRELDPEVKCYMPGVPRATYMPYPFQIIQSGGDILIAYEFAAASRTIFMRPVEDSPVDSWMGWSKGRWEGDTLVVDVTGFNDRTWFDRTGNYHTNALHVVERYTMTSPDAIDYEATIEDPNVFTRPWKISMPLYRRLEKNVRRILEYRCVEFVEEMMYGNLVKQDSD